jgi:hypothetical protein
LFFNASCSASLIERGIAPAGAAPAAGADVDGLGCDWGELFCASNDICGTGAEGRSSAAIALTFPPESTRKGAWDGFCKIAVDCATITAEESTTRQTSLRIMLPTPEG